MKTTTLDEIVFRDRNKNYGAYDLRKRYNKAVILSFIGALFITSGLVGVPMVQAMMNKHKPIKLEKFVSFDPGIIIDPETPPTPPPPPPPAPIEQIHRLAYEVPLIVDSAMNDQPVLINDDYMETDINQPVPDQLEAFDHKTPEIPEEFDPPTFNPSEYARFNGGDLDAFRNWVNENIFYPEEAAKNQIMGKVYVQFCINKKGEMVDIIIIRSVDKLIDDETIRVLKLSPLWIPAKQGGTPVKQLFTIPVSFVLQ
jgi:protein TonB